MPFAMRLFMWLPGILPCLGAFFALLAVPLARRRVARAVWVAWLLGLAALTLAPAAWVALDLTRGFIPFPRWLLCFALIFAAPAAAAGFAAARLARRRGGGRAPGEFYAPAGWLGKTEKVLVQAPAPAGGGY
jgi:hypothetical protein